MNKRVVVTGLGVVSSIGTGKNEFWENLLSGRSGISEIESFDVSQYPSRKGGEIKGFDPEQYIDLKRTRNAGRASLFALAGAELALRDSGIDEKKNKDIGVVIGTTMADAPNLEQIDKHWIKNGEDAVWDTNIRKYAGYNLSDNISFYYGLRGMNYLIPTACAAGNYSIGFAYDLIRQGRLDVMIAGGADPIARTNFAGFHRLIAMAPDKCRPFDRERKGMMVGEGAGIVVVEELEHAQKRGASIYGEILGYGLSCDAYNMTIPSEEGIVKVMERTIKNSGIDRKDIDYICAHGTGTIANDSTECKAIKRVFGDMTENIPISSIKSMIGHTMGAASVIEAIACFLSIRNNKIPPTINFNTSDPKCDIDCVPNKYRKVPVKLVLNNSFAFGGNNAALVLKEYEK